MHECALVRQWVKQKRETDLHDMALFHKHGLQKAAIGPMIFDNKYTKTNLDRVSPLRALRVRRRVQRSGRYPGSSALEECAIDATI